MGCLKEPAPPPLGPPDAQQEVKWSWLVDLNHTDGLEGFTAPTSKETWRQKRWYEDHLMTMHPFPDSFPFLCLPQVNICHWDQWADLFLSEFLTSSLTFPHSSIMGTNLLWWSSWSLNITFLISRKFLDLPLPAPPGLVPRCGTCVRVRVRVCALMCALTSVFVSVCRYVKVKRQPPVSVFPFLFEGCFEPCLRALTETGWFNCGKQNLLIFSVTVNHVVKCLTLKTIVWAAELRLVKNCQMNFGLGFGQYF